MIRLLIPNVIWDALLAEFSRHPSDVERVAYLDGYLADEAGYPDVDEMSRTGVVTTAVLPEADLSPGSYRVSATAMQQAGRHLSSGRMTRLAQVHTHGNDWVNHSVIDDTLAYSQAPGAVSLVLPYHARRRPGPHDAGVMIKTNHGTWHRVRAAETTNYVDLIPAILDYRDPACLTPLRRIAPSTDPPTGIFSRSRLRLHTTLTAVKAMVRRRGRSLSD